MPIETLIDADGLRATFDIASQIANDRLTFSIENASRTLRSWVGDDAYDDAADETPDDELRASALIAAETYLSMYHALLVSGAARIRQDGLVKSEQDTAGVMGGQIVNQFYTPKELIELRQEYFHEAETLAAEFVVEAPAGVGNRAGTITMPGGWREVTSDVQVN